MNSDNNTSFSFLYNQKALYITACLLVIAGVLITSCISPQPKALPIKVDMSRFNPEKLHGPQESTREKISLNGVWDFYPIIDKKRKYGPDLEKLPTVPGKEKWGKIRVPAKWSCAWCDPSLSHNILKHWQNANRAWYKRDFTVPNSMKDKRTKLHFDGVLVYTEVFVNDKSVGKHYSGVTPFSLDITSFVKHGQTNKLRMYVVTQDVHYINPPVSRYNYTVRAPVYYSQNSKNGGIWQDVYLIGEPDIIVDDAHIITSVRKKQITVNLTLTNTRTSSIELDVAPAVIDKYGNPVKTFGTRKVKVPPSDKYSLTFREDWEDPGLWSPEEPNLYHLHTKLTANGTLVDEHFQRFGFREFWIDGKNFILNGRRISFLGSWSGKIASGDDVYFRPEYLRLYLKTLKDANYIGPRMHLETPHVMDISDEIGLPVIATGISDGPVFFDPDYADEAMRHTLEDMREWLKQNRNHPSILIWSTENEDQAPKDRKVYERYLEIDRLFTKMDPTRPFMHDGSSGFDYAPIINHHYDKNSSSLDLQIHMLDQWEQSGTKPRIEGEIHPVGNEFFWSGLFRYIGDRVWEDINYRNKQWARIIRLLSGGWRASGSSGFMIHDASSVMFKSPMYTTLFPDNKRTNLRVLEFQWDDLSTPSPKPKYLVSRPLDYFNPWTDAAPRVIKTPIFESIRNAFSPILVTLARTTEHSYWNDQRAVKDVYIINESPGDLSNVLLKWRLSSEEGIEISSGSIPCSFKQGERRSVPVTLSFPPSHKTDLLKFKVKLETDTEMELSQDFMEISVYPRPEDEKWHGKTIHLYDRNGRTENLLNLQGLPFKKVFKEDLDSLPTASFLLIGTNSVDTDLISTEASLSEFLLDGGNILIMRQNMKNSVSRSVAFLRAPLHPVFNGLPTERLELWRSKRRELSSAKITFNPAFRQIPLLEVVDNLKDNIYSDYVPVIIETLAGKGRLITSNINLTDSVEQGDPEAFIMLRNLLEYSASPRYAKKPKVYYAGHDSSLIFFNTNLLVKTLQPASPHALAEGLGDGDLLIIGDGVRENVLNDQKYSLDEFVKKGGILLYAGNWSKGTVSWLPVNLTTRKLPQNIQPPYRYSTGAFHLWKRTDNQLLNGLGDLYLFNSSKARNYYIGDLIPGLEFGFVKPESPWVTGYEIATHEKSNYKGKRRLPYYDSEGDAALVILEHGKGKYILSTMPMKEMPLATRLYGSLMTNLNVPMSIEKPFLAFSGINIKSQSQ